MFRKKRLICLASISAIVLSGVALFTNDNFGINRIFAVDAECIHSGNHYLAHEATNETTGNDEYWVCCKCGESFATKPTKGQWIDRENFDLSIGGLNENFKTFLPKYLFAGENITLDSNYTYEVVSGDGAKINGGKLELSKPGSITVKVSDGTGFTKTYTKTIIDFGNVTGEATDLAAVLDVWGYGNKNGDSGVTISREEDIVDEYGSGTAKMDALHYYRPANTGSNRDRTNNMLFLDPTLVTKAVASGYTHISFYAFVPQMENGVDSTAFALFSSNSKGMVEGTNNTISAGGNNGNSWRYQSISLNSLKAGFGIGFANCAQHLYLTNVRFYGADISSVISSYLTESSGKSKDLISQDLIGKFYTPVSNNETLAYHATGSANGDGDYISFTRTSFVQTEINTPFNGVILSADWIKAAKKAGYVGLAVYFKKSATNGDTTESANYFRMRVGQTALGAFNGTQNGFVNVTISSVADGESMIIGFKGDLLTLAGMTFRTVGPEKATSWASANVINSGNLVLANS